MDSVLNILCFDFDFFFLKEQCLIRRCNYFASTESSQVSNVLLVVLFFFSLFFFPSIIITMFPGIHQHFSITRKNVISHSLPYASYQTYRDHCRQVEISLFKFSKCAATSGNLGEAPVQTVYQQIAVQKAT